jgi:hypothetical protein
LEINMHNLSAAEADILCGVEEEAGVFGGRVPFIFAWSGVPLLAYLFGDGVPGRLVEGDAAVGKRAEFGMGGAFLEGPFRCCLCSKVNKPGFASTRK